jgi:signal transduction histidine kinase
LRVASVDWPGDRATRLVETVLTRARLDARSIDRAGLPVVSFSQLAAEAVDALRASPRARSVHVEFDVPAPNMRADPDSLPIALRNLCENAVRHAATDNSCGLAGDQDVGPGGLQRTDCSLWRDGNQTAGADAKRPFRPLSHERRG